MNESGLDDAEIDDAPPQDVIAQMQHQRRHDRHRDHHHGERFHERAQQQIDDADDRDDGHRRPVELCEIGGRGLGQGADADEEREDLRAEDEAVDHRGGRRRLRQHVPEGARP